MQKRTDIVTFMKQFLLLTLSAVIGAALMWVFQGHSLRLLPAEMKYSDFVAILLTAVSALIAAIGVAFAIFALWGWAQFRRNVEAKITEITPGFLSEELKVGGARQVLNDLVVEFFRAELANPGMAEAWAAEKKRQRNELEELDESPLE